MAKSKKPRKPYNPNKTLTAYPVTIRYTPDEAYALKYRSYFHLGRLASTDCDAGDYLALEYRIKIGINLSNLFTETKVKEDLEKGLLLLHTVKEQRITTGAWKINESIEDQLRYALSLVDDIQDHTTRREQLPIFIQAEKEMDQNLKIRLP